MSDSGGRADESRGAPGEERSGAGETPRLNRGRRSLEGSATSPPRLKDLL